MITLLLVFCAAQLVLNVWLVVNVLALHGSLTKLATATTKLAHGVADVASRFQRRGR